MKSMNRLGLLILSFILVISVGGAFFTYHAEGAEKEEKPIQGPFKVASIQFNPKLNNLDGNVDELYKQIETAFKNGAKLAVAPEMATTGYYYENRAAIKPYVDTLPGKTTDKFSELTKKYDAYVVFGMAERDAKTDMYYDSSALVGPKGYIGSYRKTHQWETEEHWAAWGDLGVPVFQTKLGRIAINICMDSAYPETARLAAVGGADIIAFPTNSSAQAVSALPARAMQNGLYIVSANRSNTENGFHMIGASAVWSPEGKKLAEAKLVLTPDEDVDQTTITYATVDPKQYNNENKKRLKERRPELYQDLMLYVAPWDYTASTKPKNVHALAVQYTPVPGDKQANEDKITKVISKKISGKSEAPNLIVLPELSLTGPSELLPSDEMAGYAETIDGPTADFMKSLAKKYKTAVVYDFIEKSGGHLYNTAVLMNKDGKMDGKYRQTHLSDSDKKWASPGSRVPVFNNKDLGKVGIMIGNDVNFPELSSIFAVHRADTIAVPSSWHGQFGGDMAINPDMSANRYPDGAMPIWSEISIDAQSYTIIANYVGTEKGYKGRSALYTLDPLYGLDQPAVASSSKEEALSVKYQTIQAGNWFNQEKLISSRRTDYYKPLIEK
ncbi:nitrilase [Sporolactobacillus sp. THM7-7]|nr:nitrilase [Sporolactobacillus sp. THM7-7]